MIVEENPDDVLYEQLINAVVSIRPADNPDIDRRAKRLAVIEKDDNGNIRGGVYAFLHPGWVYIDLLWVEAGSRNKGLGRRIMAKAEEEALRRGCHSAYLWTQDFEAAGFYEKQGYKEFVAFENFIPGHKRFGFMKKLGFTEGE